MADDYFLIKIKDEKGCEVIYDNIGKEYMVVDAINNQRTWHKTLTDAMKKFNNLKGMRK